MQLIIGRDKATNKLAIIIDSKVYTIGAAGTVPGSVSRQHCMLATTDSDVIKITNLKQQNITWVNGVTIESCSIIKGKDRVELGVDRFLLDWNEINELLAKIESSIPKEIDITSLKNVWEDYHGSIERLQQRQAFMNIFNSFVPALSIGGGLVGFFVKNDSIISKVPLIFSFVLIILFGLVKAIDAKRNPKQKEKLNSNFTKKYCCPNCHYFFGYQAFDILKNNMDVCPKCRAKIKK